MRDEANGTLSVNRARDKVHLELAILHSPAATNATIAVLSFGHPSNDRRSLSCRGSHAKSLHNVRKVSRRFFGISYFESWR